MKLTDAQTKAINDRGDAAHRYAVFPTDENWKALQAARAALVALGLPL